MLAGWLPFSRSQSCPSIFRDRFAWWTPGEQHSKARAKRLFQHRFGIRVQLRYQVIARIKTPLPDLETLLNPLVRESMLLLRKLSPLTTTQLHTL